MALEVEVVKEIPFQDRMSWDLVARWEAMPKFSENDPDAPEWRATPIVPIDLTSEGYGPIYVKDESDIRSNPTGTIKDRVAWELAALYRDFARALRIQRGTGRLNGNIGSIAVPRFSIVTAGNVGNAVSTAFKKYGLPPMKILVDASAGEDKLRVLRELHADVYSSDLRTKPLSASEIKTATNNLGGLDITSAVIVEPHSVWYDWHVHEAFNENSDIICMPYGSGRLFENYLTWQVRNLRQRDPRLRIPTEKLAGMSLMGAEPVRQDSIADKLTKSYNPFVLLTDNDLAGARTLRFTGRNTGVYQIPEERIHQAYAIMNRHFNSEPSASAGLALYLQKFDEGKFSKRDKVLVVNTGKGALC